MILDVTVHSDWKGFATYGRCPDCLGPRATIVERSNFGSSIELVCIEDWAVDRFGPLDKP